MEKKRRARINHCLNELKTLILEAMKKDVSIKENLKYTYDLKLFVNLVTAVSRNNILFKNMIMKKTEN